MVRVVISISISKTPYFIGEIHGGLTIFINEELSFFWTHFQSGAHQFHLIRLLKIVFLVILLMVIILTETLKNKRFLNYGIIYNTISNIFSLKKFYFRALVV